jgi:iron transport multicopper oxidase
VALVFSCVSGILGVAVVAWYGFAGEVGGDSGKGVGVAQGGKQVQAADVNGEGKAGGAVAGSVGGDEDGDGSRER